MKRFMISTICTMALLCPHAVAAQGKGKGGGAKPKVTTTAAAQGGAASRGGAAKTTHMTSSPGAQGGSKVRTTTTTAARGGGQAKTTAGAAKGPKAKSTTTTTTASAKGPKAKSTTASSTTTSGSKHTSTTATTTTTSGGTTLSPVQQKLQKNTNLASKLESRLPAGTDVTKAAEGFKNLGQFVAAVNVSNNLGLDFTKVKTAMVDDGMSLGQAIQSQKASVDGATEARRAQSDADTLIRSTETTTSDRTTRKTRASKDEAR